MNGLSFSFFLNIGDYVGPLSRKIRLLNRIKERPGIVIKGRKVEEMQEAGVIEIRGGKVYPKF